MIAVKYFILCEKPSAGQIFSEALGGARGEFNGMQYVIGNAHGHLFRLAEPQEQVDDPMLAQQLSKFLNLETIPWNLANFKWDKVYLEQKNFKTGRKTTTKGDVERLAKLASECDAIIIATDNDPSGEGDVLGMEIVQAFPFRKPIYRLHYEDDAVVSIRKAFERKQLTPMDTNDLTYRKGLARERFDYATMQLSRLATRYAAENGYDGLIRPGRLKSVIMDLIYTRTRTRDNFQAEMRYQAVFEDENKNRFKSRNANAFADQYQAENQLSQLRASTITIEDAKRKKKQAPKLFDFAKVGSVMTKFGYKPKEVIDTYQRLYEKGYLSYPRTEDKEITVEQFNDLLQIVDVIANIVGVDPTLLVNRTPRRPYVTDKGLAHGANRPGLTVPESLDALRVEFGDCGARIYEIVAKSYLATLAADYEYDYTLAYVTDFPDFRASKSVGVVPGYKNVLGILEHKNEDTKTKDVDNNDKPFGTNAFPALYSFETSKPSEPTVKMVLDYLTKNEVGHGATRMATLANLMENKSASATLTERKGKLVLTPLGYLTGAAIHNCLISSPRATVQLTDLMKQVEEGKVSFAKIYEVANYIIEKDRQTMVANLAHVGADTYLTDKLPLKNNNSALKVKGVWKGKEISFKKVYMDHTFTADEIQKLLAGQTITITVTSKKGKEFTIDGLLAEKEYNGRRYVGFSVPAWER